jgi:hypothetical protein
MGAPTLHRAPEAGTPESLTVEPATTAPVETEPEVTEAATASSPGRQSTYHKLLSLDTTDRRAFLSQLRAAEEAAADEEPAEEAVEPVVPWAGPVVADQPVADETGAASGSSDERPVAVLRETATNPDEDRTTGPAAVTARVTDGVPWMTGASTTHTTGAPPGPPIPAAPAAPIKPEEPSPVDKPQPSLRPDDLSAVTTSRAALLRQMAEDVPSGPTVFAYRCSDGHLSPTTAVCCRVCGARLEEQPAIQVARPVLGKLTFSNGLTVLLDRSVIFGRDPRPFSDDPADRPNLIRPIESGELSRMHASVTIDGWQLVLRDLGSTHGTFLTLPGGTMRKLRAHEDYPLEPGSLVSLAEIVSFTYEPTA